MSSFLVSDSCINKIVSYLNRRADRFQWAFRNADGIDLSNSDDLAKLAGQLFQLNCDALDARYGRGTAARDTEGRPAEFPFQFTPTTSVAALKAIQCWSYQCSEGDIDQRPLFRVMQDVRLALAEDIVKEYAAKDYEVAAWGE